MTDPLTPAERQLMMNAGMSAGLIAAVAEAAPPSTVKVKVQHVHHTPAHPQPVLDSTVEGVVTGILAKAHGNKDAAIAAVRQHRADEFDRLKLSKMQAAAQGLTVEQKSEHNSKLHAHLGTVEASMLTLVRKHFRENGGFVQAKVKRSGKSPKVAPELDAFLLQHGDNEVLRKFLALQAAQA